MQKRLVYPIVATEYNDEDGHYFVATSPNIPEMVTQGKSLSELAYEAEDAILTMLEGEAYPEMQNPLNWELLPNQHIVYISVDVGKIS